ncbi:S-methyl-5-thioribose-1-phosphate isomerase [candidate division WOR-3 bacterium]|nr:S-methyl-5-thioribose-1-phosphate isomerase [candidate division WOR-3 bacterium]
MNVSLKPVFWENSVLYILDQRLLPFKEKFLAVKSIQDAAFAITDMAVRGAPAIGITAAFAFALGCLQDMEESQIVDILGNTRPTAKDLFTALDFMKENKKDPVARALEYLQESVIKEEKLVKNAAELIPNKCSVMTHCNTGFLAYYNWGTAFGGIAWARKVQKKDVFLWIKEARPRLQGSLTAWEAEKRAVPYKLIVDSAAAYVMKKEKIDAVLIGADRISEKLDAANKIGSLELAICAKYFNIPFYVVAPETTFDRKSADASKFTIEERDAGEIMSMRGVKIHAGNKENFYNPAFDVVPAELITAVITENGVYYPSH